MGKEVDMIQVSFDIPEGTFDKLRSIQKDLIKAQPDTYRFFNYFMNHMIELGISVHRDEVPSKSYPESEVETTTTVSESHKTPIYSEPTKLGSSNDDEEMI